MADSAPSNPTGTSGEAGTEVVGSHEGVNDDQFFSSLFGENGDTNPSQPEGVTPPVVPEHTEGVTPPAGDLNGEAQAQSEQPAPAEAQSASSAVQVVANQPAERREPSAVARILAERGYAVGDMSDEEVAETLLRLSQAARHSHPPAPEPSTAEPVTPKPDAVDDIDPLAPPEINLRPQDYLHFDVDRATNTAYPKQGGDPKFAAEYNRYAQEQEQYDRAVREMVANPEQLLARRGYLALKQEDLDSLRSDILSEVQQEQHAARLQAENEAFIETHKAAIYQMSPDGSTIQRDLAGSPLYAPTGKAFVAEFNKLTQEAGVADPAYARDLAARLVGLTGATVPLEASLETAPARNPLAPATPNAAGEQSSQPFLDDATSRRLAGEDPTPAQRAKQDMDDDELFVAALQAENIQFNPLGEMGAVAAK